MRHWVHPGSYARRGTLNENSEVSRCTSTTPPARQPPHLRHAPLPRLTPLHTITSPSTLFFRFHITPLHPIATFSTPIPLITVISVYLFYGASR